MKKQKKRIQKCEFGYIAARKKAVICRMILLVIIAAAIFIIGLLLNKMSRANIFTVIAVLFVLPWAKQAVALVVLFPYRSVSRTRYEAASSVLAEGMELYTDMVISSPEKIMNLDFIAVGNGKVIGLAGKQNQDVSYIRTYLSKGVANWSDRYRVNILENEKSFLKEIRNVSEKETSEEEDDDVKAYLRSLVV